MASSRRHRDLSMAVSGLEELAERLEDVGGNLKKALTEVLENAADNISEETQKAVRKSKLPSGGKYSKGDTERSIIRDAKAEWEGPIGSIPIGFDKTKPGAGGWLITGTPRMKPVLELERIYGGWKKGQSRLLKDLQSESVDIMRDAIEEALEGKK